MKDLKKTRCPKCGVGRPVGSTVANHIGIGVFINCNHCDNEVRNTYFSALGFPVISFAGWKNDAAAIEAAHRKRQRKRILRLINVGASRRGRMKRVALGGGRLER